MGIFLGITLCLICSVHAVWESTIDPETGKEYFYNTETNENQWDHPGLPGGWGSAISNDETQPETFWKRYYIDINGSKTQWDTPPDFKSLGLPARKPYEED